jgi:adenylosuccinate synthase
LVIIASNTIIILNKLSEQQNIYDKLVLKINKYKNIFIGTNTDKFNDLYTDKFKGNTILIETAKCKYTFIGQHVYSFITTQPIVYYFSIMSNSGVPYPFAISHDKIYLI